MSAVYNRLKAMFDNGFVTEAAILQAKEKGWITEAEYNDIITEE